LIHGGLSLRHLRELSPLCDDLADEQEVEILTWCPFASGGLVNQIRRISDGSEFWVRAVHLRRAA
jgi:hypothetical protein